MTPIVRLGRPEGLTPRETIRKIVAAGGTRAFAKSQYARLAGVEWWGNELYSVCVDRDSELHTLGPEIRCAHVSYHRRDRAPVTDWRHAQAIKSATLGDDAEAVAVHPAERRVVDTSNEFHLWAAFERESGKPCPIPFGYPVGLRTETKFEGAVQRPLAAA